jgi:hypothetical protein
MVCQEFYVFVHMILYAYACICFVQYFHPKLFALLFKRDRCSKEDFSQNNHQHDELKLAIFTSLLEEEEED